MKVKFFQGWTDQEWKLGDIQFFRFSWEFDKNFYCFLLIILNFGIQIDIG